MKGYKVFKPDWTCIGFQYKVGETYRMENEIKCCEVGFHFCEQLVDCFNYYDFNPQNKVAEVEAIGKIDRYRDKCCTDILKIVREMQWEEVLKLVNCGIGNTGLQNTGNCNSGKRNTGNCNSGKRNSGDRNTGDWNTGDWNSGGRNSGDWNSGDWNSGDWNSGGWNSGDRNSGDRNSGKYNSGSRNTGNWNSGYWNSGDWNSGSHNTGVFNTKTAKINMFDAPSDWTWRRWHSSRAHSVMSRAPKNYCTVWVELEKMTKDEKAEHPEHEIMGGYLKHIDVSAQCRQEWWDSLSDKDKNAVLSLPNFDAEKFKKCTGIKV